jgi:hemoglobin-like flavoprotein
MPLPETIDDTMIPERRQVVIESWKALAPDGGTVGAAFYRRLFEIDPGLRALFSSQGIELQAQKFVSMLDLIVQWLDVPEKLVPVLKQLGERHAGYGVREEHYGKVGTALLSAIEDGLGDRFTPEIRSAWNEAYLLISSLMRRGAAKISGTFPALKIEAEQASHSTAGSTPASS